MLSFSVTGHPLEETWGAINNSSSYWSPEHVGEGSTYPVASVTPIYDGFMVVPEPISEGAREQDRMRFAVVYVQSPLRPSIDGTLVYRGTGGDCNWRPANVSICSHAVPSAKWLHPYLNLAPSAYSDSGWRLWPRRCAQAAIVGLIDRVNAAERDWIGAGGRNRTDTGSEPHQDSSYRAVKKPFRHCAIY